MTRNSTIRQHLEEIGFRFRAKQDAISALKIYCTCLELKSRKIIKNRQEFIDKFDFPLCGYKNKYQVLDQAVGTYGRLVREKYKKDFYMDFNEADEYINRYLPKEPEPQLFDQPEAKPEPRTSEVLYNLYKNITDIGGHIAHIARTLDAISEKLEALRQ